MFLKFVINRELALLNNQFAVNYLIKNKKNGGVTYDLKNFRVISFSKPKLVGLNFFLSFFVLSNGSLLFVDFSLNEHSKGTLLFNDLYNL